jgi:uncharacterized protein YjiS (DUF1127 family)
MTTIEMIARPLKGAGIAFRHAPGLPFAVAPMLARLARRVEKQRSRVALLEISDEMLKDVGISRFEAEREARRGLWG